MAKELKILVIDDEKLIRWSFEKNLGEEGYKTITAATGEEGLKLFENYQPNVVFVDNHLPDMKGLEIISKIMEKDPDTYIIFMTAYETVDVAVTAMKNGAFEYVRKPFSFDEINIIIESIYEKINIKNELLILRRQEKEEISFDHIIHESEIMKHVVQVSKKIAKSETTTVLLLGGSGTGKDIFARAIHNASNRKSKQFVTINCSSFPDTLLESELFGHEKGAFTDAKSLKKGLFEIADGGTVFLDEIGETSLATQVKLLGVVENRTIMRLGSTKEIPVDVRIIAATNKNIRKSIEDGSFREDLYYRLQVFQIEIPALNERKEDIPLLLDYFLALFNDMFRKNIAGIDQESKELLSQYSWPGNVRELRNVMERAVILQSGNKLMPDSLPCEINGTQSRSNGNGKYLINFPKEGISLEELEKQAIRQALEMSGFNQTKASKLLNISRDTLRYKQKKHGL